jgi:formiminoglutamase
MGHLLNRIDHNSRIKKYVEKSKILYLGNIRKSQYDPKKHRLIRSKYGGAYPDTIIESYQDVETVFSEVQKINSNISVLAIGGDHGFAHPNFYTFKGKKGIVVADAHLDASSMTSRISGRMDGFHSGTPFYATLARAGSNVSGENLHYLGVMDSTQFFKSRSTFLKSKGLRTENIHLLEEVRTQYEQGDIDLLIDQVYQRLKDNGIDTIHTSICIDVVNREEAPGRSARNEDGVPSDVVLRLAYKAGENPHVRLFDILETAPPLDQDDKTSKLAANVIVEFLKGHANR